MQVFKVTATGLVYTGQASVESVTIVPGSDDASIVLNDSLDGTGSDKGACKTDEIYSNDATLACTIFKTGIYATLVGTNAVAYIYIE